MTRRGCHTVLISAPAPELLDAARPRSGTERAGALGRQPQQPHQRLRVVAALDRLVETLERPWHDLDALAVVGLGAGFGQTGGEVDDHPLVGEAGAGVEAGQLTPIAGGLADLLRELALGGL